MAVYSFLDVQASINGPGGSFSLGSSAGAADEGITVDMIEDKNTMTIGAGGDGMHSLHGSDAGKFTIHLLKTSPTNAKLNALYNLQKSSSALWGQNLITIANLVTGDTITGKECAFVKQAPVTYAKDGNVMEWAFDVVHVHEKLGSGTSALQ